MKLKKMHPLKIGNVGKAVGNNISGLGSGVGKAVDSVGGGIGSAVHSVTKPLMNIEKSVAGQVKSTLTSPIIYVGVLMVGGIVLTSIFKGSEVANNGINAVNNNPELAMMMI
jgi:hypothetical protein